MYCRREHQAFSGNSEVYIITRMYMDVNFGNTQPPLHIEIYKNAVC